jgi:hypothetical protein
MEAVNARPVIDVAVFSGSSASGRGLVHRMKLKMTNPLLMRYWNPVEQFEVESC